MICQGDLGPHEGKIRILMARSLGEVKWIDLLEWAQNVKKKKLYSMWKPRRGLSWKALYN